MPDYLRLAVGMGYATRLQSLNIEKACHNIVDFDEKQKANVALDSCWSS